MKLYELVISSIALLVGINLVAAQDKTEPNGEVDLIAWNAAKENWHRLSENPPIRAGDVKSAYQAIQAAWDDLPPYWKKDTSPAMAQSRIGAAVDAAKFLSIAEATGEAVAALQDGAKLALELEVAFSQGRTDNTFRSRASVHARLFAETGANPLLGIDVGYDIWQQGNGYAALQEGGVWEQASTLFGDDPGLFLPSETEGKMAILDSKGMIIQELSVAITKGSGSPKSRLAAIFKHVSAQPESEGRLVKQEPGAFFAEQPSTTTTPTSPTPLPPTRQVKTSEVKPAPPPNEEPTSSTPWSIIVVLIVAATGLLWLLVRKRK